MEFSGTEGFGGIINRFRKGSKQFKLWVNKREQAGYIL